MTSSVGRLIKGRCRGQDPRNQGKEKAVLSKVNMFHSRWVLGRMLVVGACVLMIVLVVFGNVGGKIGTHLRLHWEGEHLETIDVSLGATV